MSDTVEGGVARATRTSPRDVLEVLDPLAAIFVMAWIVKSRYTDTAARARRSEPLSAAVEM